MTRSVDDLAADVLAGINSSASNYVQPARAALSELVALVGTLTQEREMLRTAYAEATWTLTDRAEAAEAALADMRRALEQVEDAALKAAQLLPMTLSTSVEADHRDDHPSWAGWLLRHKVLPVARRALAAAGPAPEETRLYHGAPGPTVTIRRDEGTPTNTPLTPDNHPGGAPEETT